MGFASFSDDISKRDDEDRHDFASILGPAGGIPTCVYVVKPFKFDRTLYIVPRQRHDPGYDLHEVFLGIHQECDCFTRRLSTGIESEEWEAVFDHAIRLLRKWGDPKNDRKGTQADLTELKDAFEKAQAVADSLAEFGGRLLGLVDRLRRLKHFHPTVQLDYVELAVEEHALDAVRSWREIKMLPRLLDSLYDNHPELNRLDLEQWQRESALLPIPEMPRKPPGRPGDAF